jgi:hypothetical protein
MFGVIKLFNFICLMLNLSNFIKRWFFCTTHKDIGTLYYYFATVVFTDNAVIIFLTLYYVPTSLWTDWFVLLSELYFITLLQLQLEVMLVIYYTNVLFNKLSSEIIYLLQVIFYYATMLIKQFVIDIFYLLQLGFYYRTVGYKLFIKFATIYYFMIKSYIYVSMVFVDNFISLIFLVVTLFIVLRDLYYHYLRNTLVSYVLSLRFHTCLLILWFFW